jgi:hypothetical protein
MLAHGAAESVGDDVLASWPARDPGAPPRRLMLNTPGGGNLLIEHEPVYDETVQGRFRPERLAYLLPGRLLIAVGETDGGIAAGSVPVDTAEHLAGLGLNVEPFEE